MFYINKDGLSSQQKRLWESRSSRKRSRHCRRFPLYWNVTFIFNCEIPDRVIYKKIWVPIMMIGQTIFARSKSILSDQNVFLLSYNIMEQGLVNILLDQDDRVLPWTEKRQWEYLLSSVSPSIFWIFKVLLKNKKYLIHLKPCNTSFLLNGLTKDFNYIRPHKINFLFPILWRLKKWCARAILFLFLIFSTRSIFDYWDKNNFTFSTYHVKCICIIEDRNVYLLW